MPHRVGAWSCSGVAMLLATVATWKGPGLSQDSVGYLSTGVNVARGDGLRMLADQALTIFPPGLPLVAALGELVGLGAATTLRVVSIVSFGAIVLLGNRLLLRAASDPAIVLGSTVLLALAPALLGVATMAWSEPPFIAVSLGFLLALATVWEQRSVGARQLVLLAALASVAFLLRYIGISLVAVGGLALLVALRPITRGSLERVAAFGLLCVPVPLICMLRNRAADGTILGNRLPSHDSLREVTSRTLSTIGGWVLPGVEASTRVLGVVGLLAVGTLGVALLVLARRAQLERAAAAVVGCCALFVAVYLAYLTVAALRTSFEPTNSRYLSPIFVPVVVVGAAVLDRLLRAGSAGRWRPVAAAGAAALVAAQLVTSVQDVRDGARDGIGFNSPGWTESEVAAAAEELVRETPGVVYSNHPNPLWVATGMQPIRFAPRHELFRGARAVGELDAFAQRVACTPDPSYLVFYLLGDERVMSLAEIKEAVEVEAVGGGDDGAVFRVTSDVAADDCAGVSLRPARLP